MNFSKRMDLFPESIFTVLANKAAQRKQRGLEVIDFSTGTPNIPPNKSIREVLSKAALDPKNYVYAINDLPELIEAVINWYQRRYDVSLNNDEVCSLLGSQEGLSHLAMTLINEGDTVLVPNPSYPVFKDGPLIAGARIVEMPLLKENNYLIDFNAIDKKDAALAKFMVVSYPNNPTCGIAKDINDYIDLLASDAPAPGGGSASALCGAQGAGLCAMVAALTLGKKKYEEHQELCRDVYEQARMLSERMCALIDEDTEAFNRVSAAFKLPKDTDEDKAARKTAIAEATLGATMVPLDTLHRAHDGLELAKMLIGKSNTNCASDIGVAALNLVSCARGAWLNILINLGGIADAEKAQEIRAKGEGILAECESMGGDIYAAILKQTEE